MSLKPPPEPDEIVGALAMGIREIMVTSRGYETAVDTYLLSCWQVEISSHNRWKLFAAVIDGEVLFSRRSFVNRCGTPHPQHRISYMPPIALDNPKLFETIRAYLELEAEGAVACAIHRTGEIPL